VVKNHELAPLSKTLGAVVKLYPSVRCGKLLEVVMKWIGIGRMGRTSFQSANETLSKLLLVLI